MDLDWIWNQKPPANRDSTAETEKHATKEPTLPIKAPPRHLVAKPKDSFVDSAINVARERRTESKAPESPRKENVEVTEPEYAESKEFVTVENPIKEARSLLEDDNDGSKSILKDAKNNNKETQNLAETLASGWISKAQKDLKQEVIEKEESEMQRAWRMANANISMLKRQVLDETRQHTETKRALNKAEAEIAIYRKSLDRQDDKVREDTLQMETLKKELDACKLREETFREKHVMFKNAALNLVQQHRSSMTTLQEKSKARSERLQNKSSLFKKRNRNRKLAEEEELQNGMETVDTLMENGINSLIEILEKSLE